MKQSKNQKGFAVFEVMFFVLLAAVLVGAAYYVGQHSGKKSKDSAAATSAVANATKSAPASTPKYLDIKELGVKFQLSSKISDAYYGQKNGYYYFSVHSFDSNSDLSGCSVSVGDDGGRGIVALIVAKVGQPGADEVNDPWTIDDIKQAGLKQVGDTYYGFQKGNGPCYNVDAPNADTIAQQENNVIESFVAATPTFAAD